MQHASLNEGIMAKGLYVATLCDPRFCWEQYRKLVTFLKENPLAALKTVEERMRHADIYAELVTNYEKLAKISEVAYENLVPTAGRNVIARRLANNTTYTGIINYAALGSSTTTPANGDTTLGTETYRKTLDSQTYVNNIAYLSAFIPAGTATGTHNEGGLFIDGTGSADTGQIFSHVLFSPAVTKAALNSLTLDITITLT